MSPRQRRGLVILGLAVVGAVVSFLAVVGYTQGVARQLGPRQGVVVAAADIEPYAPIDAASLEVIQVPEVFAPPDALTSVEEVSGRVSPLPLPAGTYLQDPSLTDPPVLVFGERAVTLFADVEASLGGTVQVDDIVDIVAAYPQDQGVESVVVVEAARVIAVGRVDPEDLSQVVTLAVSPEDIRQLARARASAEALVVSRLSPDEVGL
ncbi:MAG: Flp pilus assembly protein CpaB [Kineosporiaceae bacterium]